MTSRCQRDRLFVPRLQLAPEVEDALLVFGESGTTYELNLSTSDNSDRTVVISHFPEAFQVQAEQAGQVPAWGLMSSTATA